MSQAVNPRTEGTLGNMRLGNVDVDSVAASRGRLGNVERVSAMPYETLKRDYLDVHRPVILTDLASDWPAMARWTPSFFRDNYGQRLVDVYDESFSKPGSAYLKPTGKMALADFLRATEDGKTNLRLFLFELFKFAPELRSDIVLPKWVGLFSRRILMSFFGGRGGTTTFHFDVDLPHVFHSVIYGEKVFYLYGPEQAAHLHRQPWTVRSDIDTSAPDLKRFPNFARARGQRCVVRAGETLVIPSKTWHQVHYASASWGVAFRKYELKHLPRAAYNMIVQETVDKLLTKLAPVLWTRWKREQSGERFADQDAIATQSDPAAVGAVQTAVKGAAS